MGEMLGVVSRDDSMAQSFIGGRPRIPPATTLPLCSVCDHQQTFFFQVDIGSVWPEYSIAMFACTRCSGRAHPIPEMLPELIDVDVPEGFVTAYQRSFAILAFRSSTGQDRESYEPSVARAELNHRPGRGLGSFGRIGDPPVWIQSEERPRSYAGRQMEFLLQVRIDFEYATNPSADPQMVRGLTGTDVEYDLPQYRLFLGNSLYLFGTRETTPPSVYAITQCD